MAKDRSILETLRHQLATLEGRLPETLQTPPVSAPAAVSQGPAPPTGTNQAHRTNTLSLGPLNGFFQHGGLPSGNIHEFYGEQMRQSGALSGFALAVLCQQMKQKTGKVVWVCERSVSREVGLPYGPGLLEFGIDPGRIILVQVKQSAELFWALEEALQCTDLAGVVGEVAQAQRVLSLTVSRRLGLRSQGSGVPLFLLAHGSSSPGSSAALSRWWIEGRAAGPAHMPHRDQHSPRALLGNASWQACVDKNRQGTRGRKDVEWNHAAAKLVSRTPTHSVPLAERTQHRPMVSSGAGQVVALRRPTPSGRDYGHSQP
ncbi:ImuA family protein [Polycladidibacter hongkongensis]|uniref:ImuA family protein n=1 Tax=Polycladidibacter hongkongensis TaxID=1647556 RepID=UPI00082E43C0|nr:hypothetical protein [Pseudovibrio hongkongensis]